jgi:uncharacterized membrane protein YciS (DUF1049 family)
MRIHSWNAQTIGLVVLAIVLIACGKGESSCERVKTTNAEFLIARGEYALVILDAALMTRTFGEEWADQTLFYSYDRGITDSGPAAVSGPLQPLPKGVPILVLSGTDWERVVCPVYVLETREVVLLSVRFQPPDVAVESGPSPRKGEPRVLPNGRLVFD